MDDLSGFNLRLGYRHLSYLPSEGIPHRKTVDAQTMKFMGNLDSYMGTRWTEHRHGGVSSGLDNGLVAIHPTSRERKVLSHRPLRVHDNSVFLRIVVSSGECYEKDTMTCMR